MEFWTPTTKALTIRMYGWNGYLYFNSLVRMNPTIYFVTSYSFWYSPWNTTLTRRKNNVKCPPRGNSNAKLRAVLIIMTSQKRKGGNAFDRIMDSSKKQKSSGFVLCPAGCGAQVANMKLNEHLDKCLQGSWLLSRSYESGESCQSVGPRLDVDHSKEQTSRGKLHTTTLRLPTVTPIKTIKVSTKTSPVSTCGRNHVDAFSVMMRPSKRAVSVDNNGSRFHLNDDFSLTWTRVKEEFPPSSIIWSASVQLRQEKLLLTLSTSTFPDGRPTLVKEHSCLSLSVLKSILQKAIRRRRPLPAVRTAMEIIDKNLGELLRRLPIIILEDSFLHPDIPLLVWLMAAESKGYQIPRKLITKVLQIVHEVASCPWSDCLTWSSNENRGNTEVTTVNSVSPKCELILRSISLRAKYGGMVGDVKMLKLYEKLWNHRFQELRFVPSNMLKQVGIPKTLDWGDLPLKLHERLQEQSKAPVSTLVHQGLFRLEFKDVCVEGVDFHCSSVLDQLISHQQLFHSCIDFLSRDGLHIPGNQHEWLMEILRQCMWNYSSGVNHRRSFSGENVIKDDDTNMKCFWQELIAPMAQEYMKRYIKERLVQNCNI